MIYIITVNYNEKGKKLTGRNTIQLQMERDFKPTNIQVEEFVYEEVPEQMVDNFVLNEDNALAQLKVGDLVKLTQTITGPYSQTTRIDFVKIININESGIKVENVKNYFQFNGVEKTRKKKDIAKIEIPTEDEIKDYLKEIEKNELITEIEELVQNGALQYLDNYELKDMLETINGK